MGIFLQVKELGVFQCYGVFHYQRFDGGLSHPPRFVKTRSFKWIQGNPASCSASLFYLSNLCFGFCSELQRRSVLGRPNSWLFRNVREVEATQLCLSSHCSGRAVSVHSLCDSVATWFIHRQFAVWRLDFKGAPLWSICFANIHSFRRAFPADCWRSFRCRCSGDQVCLTVSEQDQAQVSVSSLSVWSRANQTFQSIPVGEF